MSQKRQARRASKDRAKALAKLHALERLYLAGLIDDPTHEAKLARLNAELDAADAVDDLARWASQPLAPPPPAPAAAPSRALASAPPPSAPPPGAVAPPGPAPATPLPRPRPRRRWVLLASAAAGAVLVAGTAVGAVALRSRSHPAATGAVATAAPRPTAPAQSVDAGGALAALRAAPPLAGGAVIDAAHADTLVRAFWSVREQALLAHDRAAVKALETGAAADADTVGCTSVCATTPRPITEMRLFVPRDTGFPAAFLAEVLTTTPAGDISAVERLVFTRSSRAGLWSLALASTVAGAEHLDDAPETDRAGFDAAPPLLPDSLPPIRLPGALAAYYQHWAQRGAAPAGTTFAPGPFTDALGTELHARVQLDAQNGAVDTVRYTTDLPGDGAWTFATSVLDGNGLPSQGWSITCTTVRYQRVSVPANAGRPLLQPADRSRFGPLLVPGSYQRVTVSGVQQACVEEQPRFTSLAVSGGEPQDTSVVGSPSSGG